jgi:hypothetical protein
MISVKFDSKMLTKTLNNIAQYSQGFLDGVALGKPALLANIGFEMQELVSQYIDASARVNPSELHHVYEWHQAGSPSARLFDVNYVVRGGGLSMNATLRQSDSIKRGSNVPFRNKASIMENGASVSIRPKNSTVLAFEDGGDTVFTRSEVTVQNPGGSEVQGSFEQNFRQFFLSSLSQSMIFGSGLGANLKNPADFDANFSAGARGGRTVGMRAGQAWISRKV